MMRSCVLAFVAMVAIACGASLDPTNGKPADPKVWPCGYHGKQCPKPAGGCCNEYDDCGDGVTGCPADSCCYSGDDVRMGARKTTKKFAETR